MTPTEGVHYCGYPIAELAHFSPEDIVYLLFNKELPTPEQSRAFKADMSARGAVPDSLAAVFHTLPVDGHPMDWLSVGIHTLGMLDTTGDWKEDALNLIARMPRLMGLLFRIREGRTENIPADDTSLSMVQRFVRTLDMDGVDDDLMEQILATYLVLHMDHGGGNLSTFTGKAIASGHATVFASIAGAMNALSGPLHGRANQSCLEFVLRIGTSDPAEVEAFVRGELAAKRPVFGFGLQFCERRTPVRPFNLPWANGSAPTMRISRSFARCVRSLLASSVKMKKFPIRTPTLTSPAAPSFITSGSRIRPTTPPSLVGLVSLESVHKSLTSGR